MVLCVGLEVVHIDSRQPRDEQLQLLLVEDGDKPLGDDVIEAFQEAVQLLTDGPGHLHLAYQVDVLQLVLRCDGDVATVGFQVSHFGHPKLLNLRKQKDKQVRDRS